MFRFVSREPTANNSHRGSEWASSTSAIHGHCCSTRSACSRSAPSEMFTSPRILLSASSGSGELAGSELLTGEEDTGGVGDRNGRGVGVPDRQDQPARHVLVEHLPLVEAVV